ncbi:MAG: DUF58 domain-containing protein [Thermoguttaceae bacterium]
MRWFFCVVLLLLMSLAFDLGLLAYAMYVLLGVLLVSRALAKTWVENLSAVRECNRYSAQVGETVAVVVTIENAGRLPVPWVLLEDLLPPSALIHEPPALRVLGDRLQLAMLSSRGRKSMLYQLQCNRRGYYQIGPLLLETGDLFGLHRRYRIGSDPHFLLVYPEVVALDGWDVASRRPIGEVRMTHRLYEDPTRIAGVRAYEAGDPLNRIHWRATARTGMLHSKVYEPSTVVGATLLLDFHRSAFDPHHEPFRSELAVTTIASLANAVYQMGHQVGLVTNGRDAADRIRQEGWDYDIRSRQAARRVAAMLDESDRLSPVVVETRRGVEQLSRILEALARVELTDGLNFAELVEETVSRLPRDATIVAMPASVPAETAVTLGNLRRRGFAVTAIVNIFDEYEFEQASARLLAEGIEVRQLKDKQGIATICRSYVLG